MEWTQAKSAKQIVLDGVSVEIDRSDSSFNAVTLTDKSGNKLRVRNASYSLTVEVPTPPKTVQKTELSGTVLGLPIKEVFDDSYAAQERKNELEDGSREKTDLTINDIEVPDDFAF